MDEETAVHVAVGVILNQHDEVLIALRHADSHQGGLWEFPGGKLRSGENTESALSRELDEELGVRVLAAHPLRKITWDYPDRSVLLDVWTVTRFAGTVRGREGQAVKWQPRAELQACRFPPANEPIIQSLQLPTEIAITGPASSRRQLLRDLERMISCRVPAIQLRQKQLDASRYRHWCLDAWSVCQAHKVVLFANTSPGLHRTLSGPALHLSSPLLLEQAARPLPSGTIVSASCHSLGELRHAEAIGVDLALLSPVLPSTGYPQRPVLGWRGFQALADQVSLPVYALGGLGRQQLGLARQHGAHGIAGISGFVGQGQTS